MAPMALITIPGINTMGLKPIPSMESWNVRLLANGPQIIYEIDILISIIYLTIIY